MLCRPPPAGASSNPAFLAGCRPASRRPPVRGNLVDPLFFVILFTPERGLSILSRCLLRFRTRVLRQAPGALIAFRHGRPLPPQGATHTHDKDIHYNTLRYNGKRTTVESVGPVGKNGRERGVTRLARRPRRSMPAGGRAAATAERRAVADGGVARAEEQAGSAEWPPGCCFRARRRAPPLAAAARRPQPHACGAAGGGA